MSLSRYSLVAVLLGVLAAAVPSSADAQPGEAARNKAACVAAHDRAQSLSSARRLKAARSELVACSADSCPEVVREDCARSLVSLDAQMPTVVLGAQVDGHDASDAKVALDGESVTIAPGRSIAVDPGQHMARFEQAGRTVNVEFVAREGEKSKLVTGQFISPLPSPTASTGARERGEARRTPVVPILLAGTGAIALGGGLYMRLRADSDAADLKGSCAPLCDPSQRDALSDRVVLSNVALGLGAGALALAAATYLLDRK